MFEPLRFIDKIENPYRQPRQQSIQIKIIDELCDDETKENNMENDKIEITRKEYFELRLAQVTLQMLECSGVDNWEWYSESFNGSVDPDGKSLEDVEKELRKEILNES